MPAPQPNYPVQSVSFNTQAAASNSNWLPISTTGGSYSTGSQSTWMGSTDQVFCAHCYKLNRTMVGAPFQIDGTRVCPTHADQLLTIIHEED